MDVDTTTSEGQVIWVPPLPAGGEKDGGKHSCAPPEDDGLILELEGTVWRCGCGKTWQVAMTQGGHEWKRERAVRRWWRHVRHGAHPAEAAAQHDTKVRLYGPRR